METNYFILKLLTRKVLSIWSLDRVSLKYSRDHEIAFLENDMHTVSFSFFKLDH